MRHVTDAEVDGVLANAPLEERLRQAFVALAEGRAAQPPRLRTEAGSVKLSTLGGVITELGVVGAKVYTTISGRFDFVIVLFSTKTGAPLATFEANAITKWRTAAVSVLAARATSCPRPAPSPCSERACRAGSCAGLRARLSRGCDADRRAPHVDRGHRACGQRRGHHRHGDALAHAASMARWLRMCARNSRWSIWATCSRGRRRLATPTTTSWSSSRSAWGSRMWPWPGSRWSYSSVVAGGGKRLLETQMATDSSGWIVEA